MYRASSIRVAEAAKVIENTQRDLNIAFVNELAIIFERLGIDTARGAQGRRHQVELPAVPPGLVGGHCIGVDPYYLTHKAELVGYHPEVILAGRRINDSMGTHVARKTVQQMIHAGRNIKGARVNILGLTFKENVPDIRNSKVIDVIRELHEFGVETFVHDPVAGADDALHEYGVRLCDWDDLPAADALILAVAHKQFLELAGRRLSEEDRAQRLPDRRQVGPRRRSRSSAKGCACGGCSASAPAQCPGALRVGLFADARAAAALGGRGLRQRRARRLRRDRAGGGGAGGGAERRPLRRACTSASTAGRSAPTWPSRRTWPRWCRTAS